MANCHSGADALLARQVRPGFAWLGQSSYAEPAPATFGPTRKASVGVTGWMPEPQPTPPTRGRRPPAAPSRTIGARQLHGRRIAVPAAAPLDRLAAMLKRQGATVIRRPLVGACETTDPTAVEAWLRALSTGGIDQVIFLSEEGVERLAAAAERLGLLAMVRGALGEIYKIARGPKTAQALQRMGLAANLVAPPSLQAMMDALEQQGGHAGRQIGVQQFADDPTPHLIGFLEGAGARVHPVAPHRYTPTRGDGEVVATIEAMSRGQLDGITFSAALQITQLFEVAARRGLESSLREALAHVVVATTTTIVAECLHGFGARADIVPPRRFSMRRLTDAFAWRLASAPSAAVPGPAQR